MPDQQRFSNQEIYQIKVKGHLDLQWRDWFDGFEMQHQSNDETLLIGTIKDQAALHGLLAKIRDLGLSLLSVNQVAVEGDCDPKIIRSEFDEIR